MQTKQNVNSKTDDKFRRQISWFLYVNNIVTGPYTTGDVRDKLQTGLVSPQSFIWWKGQREWIQLLHWQTELPEILRSHENNADENSVWYLDTGHSRVGPITQTELVAQLKVFSEFTNVRLWTHGMSSWSSVYEMQNIMDSIGLTRRQSERAPLMGTVALTRNNDDPRSFLLRTASIGIGGLGMTGNHDLYRGDEVRLVIKSRELGANIQTTAKVMYVMKSGFAGVRFESLSAENLNFIMDYVKRFNITATSSVHVSADGSDNQTKNVIDEENEKSDVA